MDSWTFSEVRKRVEEGPFSYFKDRYAVFLLRRWIGAGRPIGEIKASPYGRLLQKDLVRELLPYAGSKTLEPWLLDVADTASTGFDYFVTYSEWSSADPKDLSSQQTTRMGTNLVIQLNFDGRHEAEYFQRFRSLGPQWFNCTGHPVCLSGRNTLAWARVDVDLATREALIEEIQSDWIGIASGVDAWIAYLRELPGHLATSEMPSWYPREVSLRTMSNYLQLLQPHLKTWSEAMLCATLSVLTDQLGIDTVYLHSWEGGNRLKRITGRSRPPRSLYTQLPKRFCFRSTEDAPLFIQRCRDPHLAPLLGDGELQWFVLPSEPA